MKSWLARKRLIKTMTWEIMDLRDCMQRRSQLIADQDAEITRLRAELKEAAKQAEYWQGKAANP